MRILATLILLLSAALPSLAATTWPANTNGPQTFYGIETFSEIIRGTATNALNVASGVTNQWKGDATNAALAVVKAATNGLASTGYVASGIAAIPGGGTSNALTSFQGRANASAVLTQADVTGVGGVVQGGLLAGNTISNATFIGPNYLSAAPVWGASSYGAMVTPIGLTAQGVFTTNTFFPGTLIQSGTVNSNAFDDPTKAKLALAWAGGGGTAQTNISYTAVTNAPWLTGTSNLDGTKITAGTVSSNALDVATKAQLALASIVPSNVVTNGGLTTNLTLVNYGVLRPPLAVWFLGDSITAESPMGDFDGYYALTNQTYPYFLRQLPWWTNAIAWYTSHALTGAGLSDIMAHELPPTFAEMSSVPTGTNKLVFIPAGANDFGFLPVLTIANLTSWASNYVSTYSNLMAHGAQVVAITIQDRNPSGANTATKDSDRDFMNHCILTNQYRSYIVDLNSAWPDMAAANNPMSFDGTHR